MKKLIKCLIIMGNVVNIYAQEKIVFAKQDGSTIKYDLTEDIDSIVCTPQKQILVWDLSNFASLTTTPPVAIFDTILISDLGAVSAVLTDNIAINTSCSFTEAGYCYSFENSVPTINDSHISLGLITHRKYFLKGLQSKRKYYIRAYVKSGTDYVYGPVSSFTTLPFANMQFSLLNFFWTKAELSATFEKTNDVSIYEKGICYATHNEPTINDAISSTGTLKNLSPNTTYYARAFTKVHDVAQYSSEISFKTRALSDSILIEGENPSLVLATDPTKCIATVFTATNKGLSGDSYISMKPVTTSYLSDFSFVNIPVHLGSSYTISIGIVPVTVSNPDTLFVKPNKFQASLYAQNSNGGEQISTLRGDVALSYFTNDSSRIEEIKLGTVTFPQIIDPNSGTLSDGLVRIKISSVLTRKEMLYKTYDPTIRVDYIKLKVVTE